MVSCSAPAVTDGDTKHLIYRFQASSSQWGPACAQVAKEIGAKSVTTLAQQNPFIVAIIEPFKAELAKLEGTVKVSCCRFGGHRDWVFHWMGGWRWDGDSSAESSSWRQSGLLRSAGFRPCRRAETWTLVRTCCDNGSRSSAPIRGRPFLVRGRSSRSSRRLTGYDARWRSSRSSATS